jgi:Ca2+-binding RTX toxin-like protein
MAIDTQTSKKLEISDANGDSVVYSGSGFSFDGEEATGGKVTKIQFFNGDGDLLLTISDAAYKLTDIIVSSVQANFDLFEKGKDTFTGSSIGDLIMYGSNKGDDTIFGLGGNDYIQGSDGRNTIDGGAGDKDVLTYSNIDYGANPGLKGIKADLDRGEVVNPWGKVDEVSGIEDIRGTKFADTFTGSKGDEFFSGLQGNDTFTGGKGADTFEYTGGCDKDKITDFGNGDDSVELYDSGVANFNQLKGLMEQKGKNVEIDFGGGDVLTFLNAKTGDFAKGDFEIFAF